MDTFGAWPEKVVIICTLVIACSGAVATLGEPAQCMYYEETKCENCSAAEQRCNASETIQEHATTCYSVWTNSTERGVHITMMGCWMPSKDANGHECQNNTCYGQLRSGFPAGKGEDLYFCCCTGNLCNKDVVYIPSPTTPPPVERNTSVHHHRTPQIYTAMMALVPIAGICGVVIVTYWLWRRHKGIYLGSYQAAIAEHETEPFPTQAEKLKPIQLNEVRARGRFGKVWRATLMSEPVAVKEFPYQERHSWEAEKSIYMLGQMNNHDNILHFIGAEVRGEDVRSGIFWLITEYHEHGSLYDYLKAHLISWTELLLIAESMASGLSFLHQDQARTQADAAKPPVAHRDFKSKNVLIKKDLTCCIADFGLAMKFEAGDKPGSTHGQVGTRRYMAPEVLEGSINFTLDSFLRIDMYACALVLWELLQRCSAADGPVGEYRLPFEAEVGSHPTLEEMQNVVVHQRKRPIFKNEWGKHIGMRALYATIEECWDADAEARLSSCCVHERVQALIRDSALTTGKDADITDSLSAVLGLLPHKDMLDLPPPAPPALTLDIPPPPCPPPMQDTQHSSSPPAYSECPLDIDHVTNLDHSSVDMTHVV